MSFLHLGRHGVRGFARPSWREQLHEYTHQLACVYGFVRVFYGIGAISLAAVLLLAVAAMGLDPLGATSEESPRSAQAAEVQVPPPYQDNVTYLVGSERAAEDLMAYGAGLPTNDPARLLPLANVRVVIAAGPADEARPASAADSSTRIVDLR